MFDTRQHLSNIDLHLQQARQLACAVFSWETWSSVWAMRLPACLVVCLPASEFQPGGLVACLRLTACACLPAYVALIIISWIQTPPRLTLRGVRLRKG